MKIDFILLNISKYFTASQFWILLAVIIYAIAFRKLSKTAKIVGVLGIMGLFLLGTLLLVKPSPSTPTTDSIVPEPATIQENNANNTNQESQTICSICGRKFTGRGYTEVSNGVWEPSDSQTYSQICSVSCGLKHTAKMNGLINSIPDKVEGSDDYFSRERARMKKQGYTEGEINQMRDPNLGDPEIKESAKRVFDAIKKQTDKH